MYVWHKRRGENQQPPLEVDLFQYEHDLDVFVYDHHTKAFISQGRSVREALNNTLINKRGVPAVYIHSCNHQQINEEIPVI